MSTVTKYVYLPRTGGELVQLDYSGHALMKACHGLRYQSSVTNTDLKLEGKFKCPTATIGNYLAFLRHVNLLDYAHIETGRHARGSGRYELKVTGSFLETKEVDVL